MRKSIADYGIIGDCESLALLRRGGALEWLAWPRFDSEASCAALLGDEHNGHWTIAPEAAAHISWRYRRETLILETEFETSGGKALLVEFMPPKDGASRLVRIVRGMEGHVEMTSRFAPAFGNGAVPARLIREADDVLATGNDEIMRLASTLPPGDGDPALPQRFTVSAGQEIVFVLQPGPSPPPTDLRAYGTAAEFETTQSWQRWCSRCRYEGPYREAVLRSMITMKTLTYAPTGGVIAAATTSLPEKLGGKRNWDYRFCWLRDSTFAVLAMLHAGFRQEAQDWTRWLLRSLDGKNAKTQPLYGIAGEQRLPETEAPWLDGFGGSRPVRFGNGAYKQFQLDLYGEVFDTIHQMRLEGEALPENTWDIQRALLRQVCDRWQEPDAGIWEQRNDPEHFTQSRVLAWVALDCAIYSAERYGFEGPVDRWKEVRRAIHAEVCEKGFDPTLSSFTRAYGTGTLDGALLLIPMVGFLPPDDPRVLGTTRAIERDLMKDGFVLRYDLDKTDDGLEDKEGTFLACSFWLADNWIMQGEREKAEAMFERLLGAANELGLMSEEYEPDGGYLLGNMPQTLTHLSLVHTAFNLAGEGPGHRRSGNRHGRADNAP